MLKRILFLFAALLLFISGRAEIPQLSSSSKISLLTCGPSDMIYALYGHAALRVTDPERKMDVVFNYGVFSFSAPHFMYRFAKGETNYMLAAESYPQFYRSYLRSGRSITEQELNISPKDKQQIFNFLVWNARPENREYRYNYFFDNCASRLRDVLENHINEKIIYTDSCSQKTFRQHIDECQQRMPWTNFGIQILIGAPADRIANLREEMFLPDYLETHIQHAKIQLSDNKEQKLVLKKELIYAGEPHPIPSLWQGPIPVLSLILLIILLVSIHQFRTKKQSYWLDYILFTINGIGGFLLLWFVLYSEHPAMHPNYNLCWLIPSNLIFILAWSKKSWRSWLSYYWIILSIWLFLLLIGGSIIPQTWYTGFYLIFSMLFIRSILHSVEFYRKKKSINPD